MDQTVSEQSDTLKQKTLNCLDSLPKRKPKRKKNYSNSSSDNSSIQSQKKSSKQKKNVY